MNIIQSSLPQLLARLDPPWVITCQRGDSISTTIHAEFETNNALIVKIMGDKSKSLSTFYKQISEIFGFPDYFGNNINALIDSFEDEKLKSSAPLVMLVTHADLLISEETAEVMHGLLSAFGSIGARWRVDSSGVEWGAPPRRFLVVLEYS